MAARVVGFVAALALTAAAGWEVGNMISAEPAAATGPAAAQEHQPHDQHEGGEHEQQRGQSAPGHHHGAGGLQMWATQTASLGIVTLDGSGRILYRSDADGNDPPVSHCTGECAQRWVPVTVPEGQEPELLGIKHERVGTLRREDGALQVTLAGWPLYTVAGDQGAHDGTGANGADGVWFAVTPTGEKAAP
ncbi:COG4315 family predicted lipoprotein [Pseudonocardia sp. DLS-67]